MEELRNPDQLWRIPTPFDQPQQLSSLPLRNIAEKIEYN